MIDRWLSALEERHLANLTFSETTRALRALSSIYVERRDRLGRTGALDSAGKRAAFALYYTPLHFLTVAAIVEALQLDGRPARHIVDLGCGGGAASAAWATRLSPPATVTGIDKHPWALAETTFTHQQFALHGETRRGDAARARLPRHADAVIAGWFVNELDDQSRDALKATLLTAASRGVQVLIVEPIATRVSPWWPDWTAAFHAQGGRADEWRFQAQLPDLLKRLDRAAGLRHEELTARSLLL